MILDDNLNSVIKEKIKVLVVDDIAYNIISFELIFQDIQNIILEKAYNGEEAI
jgi:hypothetical protein